MAEHGQPRRLLGPPPGDCLRRSRIKTISDDIARWSLPAGRARRLAEALAAQRKQALLFRRLATLRRDAPLAESLDDLAQRAPGLPAIVR